MTYPLPAYAVPGVKPADGTDDMRSVCYRGDQLAAFPLVAAALDRTRRSCRRSVSPARCGTKFAETRADLCAQLWVGTGDGLSWELSFGDGVNFIVPMGSKFFPEDLLQEALAAQPHVDTWLSQRRGRTLSKEVASCPM